MKEKMKNPNNHRLNPNWEQLRQKLQSNRPKKQFREAKGEIQRSILGKRKERISNEEIVDSCRNPLIPTSSDFSLTDVIAMDCEMVGVSSTGNKSALGRVTLVNKWGNIIYDAYVRPVDFVFDFRTQISGIRPRDLRKAKDFTIVQKKVADILNGRILVGHALRNDLKALMLTHPKKDMRDTAEYQPLLKERRSQALRHLAAKFLGADIQIGEHCPVEDARAAMLIYQKNRKQWEKSNKDFIRLMKKQKQRKHKKKSNGGSDINGVASAA